MRPPDRKPAAALLSLTFLVGLYGEAHQPHEVDPRVESHPAVHATQAGGAAQAASHGEHEPHRHDSGPCTCLGTCHGAAATPLPSACLQGPPAMQESAVRRAELPGGHGPRPASPYLLPYANAPPLV